MTRRILPSYLAVLALLLAVAAESYADRGRGGQRPAAKAAMQAQQMRARSQMQRQRTEHGFTREHTITRGDGKTATRRMTLERDPETHSVRIEMEGTDFEGRDYSRSHSVEHGEDGVQIHSSQTQRDGRSTSREITTEVDEETGTARKSVTVTDAEGNEHGNSAARHSDESDDAAE